MQTEYYYAIARNQKRKKRVASRVYGGLFISISISLFLGGCGSLMKTRYQRPVLDVPQQWSGSSLQTARAAPAVVTGSTIAQHEDWWRDFGDARLDTLIEKVLRTNNDLAVAAINLYKAHLTANFGRANLLPSITATNANGQLSSPHTWSASTGVSYELDLWGRLARIRDENAWEAIATNDDRRAIALGLIEETAKTYWNIAYLNEEISNAQADLHSDEKTLQLVQARYAAGANQVNIESVAQARSALEAQRAAILDLEQKRTELRSKFAILFDQSPAHREPEAPTLPIRSMPPLPAVLPADLLNRRWDLQAKENRLREALANADEKRLENYPTITLSGTLETGGGTSVIDILKNPAGSLAAALALPFVQWNTTILNSKSARADYDIQVLQYKQAVYQAIKEVQDTLAERGRLAQIVALREQALQNARIAANVEQARYRAGETSLQDWLDQQDKYREAKQYLVDSVYDQYVNQMQFYMAIGGGTQPQG